MTAAKRQHVDRTLAALADPTRRGVIDLLRASPRRASDIADALGASRPAMSRHLRVLRACGLVEATELAPANDGDGDSDGDAAAADARVRVYRLRPERFGELRGWLDEVEAFWSDQLASFADHIAKTKGAP